MNMIMALLLPKLLITLRMVDLLEIVTRLVVIRNINNVFYKLFSELIQHLHHKDKLIIWGK